MQYCKNCILPDTRPGITIEADGVCNACHSHLEKKNNIDWKERKKDFERIIEDIKKLKRSYDCIVPVSGGKDSTYQVVKCLDYGLKVLAITWRTPGRTEIGQRNLDNLIGLGIDHFDVTISSEVERKFLYKALIRMGSIGIPMHMAIYHIPFRIAVALDIPLIVWGESPVMEYGGNQKDFNLATLDHTFLKKHGILQGTSLENWADENLTLRELEVYKMPDEKLLNEKNIRSVFIGYYFNWSPQKTFQIATKYGFQARIEGPKVGYYNYADIDCDFISVHHYFKWLKFGFNRLFDNLSLEIRNGCITREQAIKIIRESGDQVPYNDIKKLCNFLKIAENHFWEIVERFRNRNIWLCENGKWVIKDFIIKDWWWK